MSKTRNLSDLLDANGDVKSSALDNVPASDVVNDTSPQLGGDLASNGHDILMADSDKIKLGTGTDLEFYHDGNDSYIQNDTGGLFILGNNAVQIKDESNSKFIAKFVEDGACELYHNNSKKIETTSGGVTITGTATATAFSGDGSALTNVPAGVSDVDIVVVTSSGTYTPTSGTKFVRVYATGGGGGGGGVVPNSSDRFLAAGGNGGNTAVKVFTATELGADASISIGSGGSVSQNDGGNGGDTSFNPAGTGATITGTGGYGGKACKTDGYSMHSEEQHTSTGNGDYNHFGDFGRHAFRKNNSSSTFDISGAGGRSYFGRGGQPIANDISSSYATAGNAGTFGGGGGGAAVKNNNGSNRNGGAGGAGVVVIEEYA